MITSTIRCTKFYNKVTLCPNLNINTLNNLLRLNLLDGHAILYLLDDPSELNVLNRLIMFKRVRQVYNFNMLEGLVFVFMIDGLTHEGVYKLNLSVMKIFSNNPRMLLLKLVLMLLIHLNQSFTQTF